MREEPARDFAFIGFILLEIIIYLSANNTGLPYRWWSLQVADIHDSTHKVPIHQLKRLRASGR